MLAAGINRYLQKTASSSSQHSDKGEGCTAMPDAGSQSWGASHIRCCWCCELSSCALLQLNRVVNHKAICLMDFDASDVLLTCTCVLLVLLQARPPRCSGQPQRPCLMKNTAASLMMSWKNTMTASLITTS